VLDVAPGKTATLVRVWGESHTLKPDASDGAFVKKALERTEVAAAGRRIEEPLAVLNVTGGDTAHASVRRCSTI